jgi:hypothetical protein
MDSLQSLDTFVFPERPLNRFENVEGHLSGELIFNPLVSLELTDFPPRASAVVLAQEPRIAGFQEESQFDMSKHTRYTHHLSVGSQAEDVIDLKSTDMSVEAIMAYMFATRLSVPHFRGCDNSALYEAASESPNHYNTFSEQLLQFPESPNRTFSIYQNNPALIVPSPRRGARISASHALDLAVHPNPDEPVVFIDARFAYEHFHPSVPSVLGKDTTVICIDEYWDAALIVSKLWNISPGTVSPYPIPTPKYPGAKLVIFCEFSSMRGPGLYKNIGLIDNVLRRYDDIPMYPEIYIVQGGFTAMVAPKLAALRDFLGVAQSNLLDAQAKQGAEQELNRIEKYIAGLRSEISVLDFPSEMSDMHAANAYWSLRVPYFDHDGLFRKFTSDFNIRGELEEDFWANYTAAFASILPYVSSKRLHRPSEQDEPFSQYQKTGDAISEYSNLTEELRASLSATRLFTS